MENPENEWISRRFWTTLGYDPETMSHSPEAWQQIIFEEDLKVAIDNFEKHCRNPRYPYDQIVRYRHTNGSTIWIRCRGLAIRDASGKAIRMLGAHTDVTPVHQKQEEADKNAFLRPMIEAAPFGIIVADEAGEIVLVNSRIPELFGWSRSQLVGQKIELLLPEPARKAHVHHRANYAKENAPRLMGRGRDLKAKRRDGSLFDVEVGLSPFRAKDGNYVIASVADITDRRSAEAAALELAAIVQSSQDAIIGKTLDGIVTSWNPGAEALYGYTAEEMIDQPQKRIIPEDRVSEFESIMANLKQGKAISQLETVRRRKDGSTIKVSLSISPVRDANGIVRGASTIARDITQRARMEAKQGALTHDLERANAILERQNQELTSFAYITSHDLQEPLRSISSFVQLLKDGYADQLDDNAREYIDFAVSGADRLKAMIKSLLAYSRLDRPREKLSRFSIATALSSATKNLDSQIKEFHAQVEYPEDTPYILGDLLQITQVFQNLISNAIKFRSAEDPRIRISRQRLRGSEIDDTLKPDENYCVISIKDNGIGLAPQYHKKIFEVFQKLHPYSQYKGTGIGLAICSKIVKQHGGVIWLESNEGQGSDFKVALPIASSEESPK